MYFSLKKKKKYYVDVSSSSRGALDWIGDVFFSGYYVPMRELMGNYTLKFNIRELQFWLTGLLSYST